MTVGHNIFYLIIKLLNRHAAKEETISVIACKNKYWYDAKRGVVSNSEFMLLVLWNMTLDSWKRNVNINLLQVYPAADTYDPEKDFFF